MISSMLEFKLLIISMIVFITFTNNLKADIYNDCIRDVVRIEISGNKSQMIDNAQANWHYVKQENKGFCKAPYALATYYLKLYCGHLMLINSASQFANLFTPHVFCQKYHMLDKENTLKKNLTIKGSNLKPSSSSGH